MFSHVIMYLFILNYGSNSHGQGVPLSLPIIEALAQFSFEFLQFYLLATVNEAI